MEQDQNLYRELIRNIHQIIHLPNHLSNKILFCSERVVNYKGNLPSHCVSRWFHKTHENTGT